MWTQQEAIDELREIVKPGDTVRTILRHVSPSGMTRWISLIVLRNGDDGTPEVRDISWMAAKALGWRVNTRGHEGVEVGGAGMDMGFHLVYSLSNVLYGYGSGYDCLQFTPDGTDLYAASGDRSRICPSNYHGNGSKPGPGWDYHHTDGYAVSHKWL